MLMTVADLRSRVENDLGVFVDELADWTGRGGFEERSAWRSSLPALARALTHESLASIHVHFERRAHHVALEYKLPGTSACCDVVLLGRHAGKPSAVVIELKDWRTEDDRPGLAEGLIEHRGQQTLHPSDQLRGYAQYCEGFHSAVIEQSAQVSGCVLMTAAEQLRAYREAPNTALSEAFPLFSTNKADITEGFRPFLVSRLSEQDERFATLFATGTFKQDRGFMARIGKQMQESERAHLQLLDNQRHAFNLCVAHARAAVDNAEAQKHVLIVEGPPGSGKSAVAAKLWARFVTDETVRDGNITLVTTSQSQNSTWKSIIDQVSASRVGRGVVRKATSFTPIDIPQLSSLRKRTGDSNLYKIATGWRTHMAHLRASRVPFRGGAEDDSCLLTLVDEAHALINTEAEHGVGQYGFVTGLGPQAWHLMRCSRVCVFFLDPEQGFRSRENTKIEEIVGWASELGARVERVSLAGAQFRCAGSVEYVDWLEALLEGRAAAELAVMAPLWRAHAQTDSIDRAADSAQGAPAPTAQPRPVLEMRVFDDPFALEDALRARTDGKTTMRLLSSYSRAWKTADQFAPHEIAPQQLDFFETITRVDGTQRYWSRAWNVVENDDYTGFVLADRPGTAMHADPLSEVGCPYAVRGFDYDYVGILWLEDLVWRDGRWIVQLEHVHESGINVETKRARREGAYAPSGPHGVNVLEKVKQAYRILLSRALKGVYIWIADEETRAHVRRAAMEATAPTTR